MDSQQYELEYAAYEQRIQNMDERQYSEYMRDDYEFEDEFSIIPEYMDFTDVWEKDFHYQACKYAKSFIIDDLATRNAKIKCEDHEHIFSLIPNHQYSHVVQNARYISLTTETDIDVETCWFKSVLRAIHRLRDQSIDGLVSLTDLDYAFFTTMVQFEGFSKERTRDEHVSTVLKTPREQQVLYNAFKTAWYQNSSPSGTTGSTPLAKIQTELGTSAFQKIISDMVRNRRKQKRDDRLFADRHILCNAQYIYERHDFHVAAHLLGASLTPALSVINEIRRGATDYSHARDYITRKKLIVEMQRCILCNKPLPKGWSTPGIYFAPPGCGKSTALEQCFLTGIDTDWLTSGLRESEVSFFLERNIPIITNQFSCFTNGLNKMIGFVNPEIFRKRPDMGDPFLDIADIRNRSIAERTQFTVLHYTGSVYLVHRLLDMRIALYLAEYVRKRFIYGLRPGTKL